MKSTRSSIERQETRAFPKVLRAALLAGLALLASGCDSELDNDDVGSGNSFGNEVDYAGYGKLTSLKMVLNVRSASDSLPGFVVLSRITAASIVIDRSEYRLAAPIDLDNTLMDYAGSDSSRTKSPPNYFLEIPTLAKMDSISTGATYSKYLVGNLDVGEHVYSIRSLEGIAKGGKKVTIRLDTAGSFQLGTADRTKFLGLFIGRAP